MNCEAQNCEKKINWVLTEFQMFRDHKRSAEADSYNKIIGKKLSEVYNAL